MTFIRKLLVYKHLLSISWPLAIFYKSCEHVIFGLETSNTGVFHSPAGDLGYTNWPLWTSYFWPVKIAGVTEYMFCRSRPWCVRSSYLGVIQKQVSVVRYLFGKELLKTSKVVGKSDGSRRKERKAGEEGGCHTGSQGSDMVGSSGRQKTYICAFLPRVSELWHSPTHTIPESLGWFEGQCLSGVCDLHCKGRARPEDRDRGLWEQLQPWAYHVWAV